MVVLCPLTTCHEMPPAVKAPPTSMRVPLYLRLGRVRPLTPVFTDEIPRATSSSSDKGVTLTDG